MKLSKTKKVALGILSFWPLAYFILFMLFFLSFMVAISSTNRSMDSFIPLPFIIIIILHILTMVIGIGLTIYYLICIINTDLVPKNQKIVWVIALAFLNILAIPSFWYLYMRGKPQPGEQPHVIKFIWCLLLFILGAIAIFALFFIDIEYMGTIQKAAVVFLAVILFAYIWKYRVSVKATTES